MAIKSWIKRSEYHDSVTLMLVARELSRLPGVEDAAVIMGTEANKGLLHTAGMLTTEIKAATPNDLVIAIRAPQEIAGRALAEAEKLLHKPQGESGNVEFRPKTLRGAVKASPTTNLAVISVAGRYAAAEAWDALRQGLHVLLFSDNVSLEDEIALKEYAVEHGLLLMGPGAGTAILNGIALGFANVLPDGPVGIVSAAGTGLQEVSTLLAKCGVGLSQGIGTGGRDLQEAVGGLMMLAGLRALQDDPNTRVIILVSKPPAPNIAQKVLDQVAQCNKPTIACFLGMRDSLAPTPSPGGRGVKYSPPPSGEGPGVREKTIQILHTLEEAAIAGANLAFEVAAVAAHRAEATPRSTPTAAELHARLNAHQRYLRGLYSGGTLCYEAQVIWRDLLPEPVYSNAPLEKSNFLPDSTRSQAHTAVDLGEEEFTVGRPHPMIDNDLRIRRLVQEAFDPQVGVILLDVVLGYGAHPDPARELGPAVHQAIESARQAGRELIVIGSVTGTEADPQCLSRQVQGLQQAGMIVCESNAAAAHLAAAVIIGREHA
jgi:succinyl-CoA synthetase alpha subunit